MFTCTVSKTIEDENYVFSANGATAAEAELYARTYASMVEYALAYDKYAPGAMFFPKENLYQFIAPQVLATLEAQFPMCVDVAYQNALAYVESYVGNMFDLPAMIASGDTSHTANTLRLILCLATAQFVLASTPQYADVTRQWNDQLLMMLRGLKQGSRNFGKNAIEAEPNARVEVVTLGNKRGL